MADDDDAGGRSGTEGEGGAREGGRADPPPGSIRELILASAPDPAERERHREPEPEKASLASRLVGIALLAAAVLAVLILLRGGDSYTVTAHFANASQLVEGNEVVVGGSKVGSVETIELGDNGEALVTLSVEEDLAPLRRGTTATVRSTSLSQIAGRQVQLTLPPEATAGEEIDDGGEMTSSETVSEVDLDQIFNTLSPKTIRDFKHVIQGFELSYEGVAGKANRGLRYLNPFLSTSRRVFGELAADRQTFENLIVDTSELSGALAARAPDLSALIGNLDLMMNALGDRKQQLAESISLLPDFMRNANTTFVNLRAALDDVDPLVDASKPAVERLRPFLAELRVAADDAVPTVRDLDRIISDPGPDNDLVELTNTQPALAKAAVGSGSPDCGPGPDDPADLEVAADGDFTQGSFGESLCALRNGNYNLSYFRAYTPELVGWFDDFGPGSGYTDAIGGIGRIATTFNTFTLSLPGNLPNVFGTPLTPEETLASLDLGNNQRCPGGNERPAEDLGDDSVPFTDGGALTDGNQANGECEPSQVQPGP